MKRSKVDIDISWEFKNKKNLLRALKQTKYIYPVPVDPDPAEEIEHIEDFRDPSEDGDEGGVWKLNAGCPPFSPLAQLFMSLITLRMFIT